MTCQLPEEKLETIKDLCTLQGHISQLLGDGQGHSETHGMCHLLQTCSSFDKCVVSGHPGDGAEVLQYISRMRILHKEWLAFAWTVNPILDTLKNRIICLNVDNMNVNQAWLNGGSILAEQGNHQDANLSSRAEHRGDPNLHQVRSTPARRPHQQEQGHGRGSSCCWASWRSTSWPPPSLTSPP